MATTRAGCRIGIDVGGTFTDFVLTNRATGELVRFKEPSVPADPSMSVRRGIPKLLERAKVGPGDVELIVRHHPAGERDHPAPWCTRRPRRRRRPSRRARDRPHEPRQLARLHAQEGGAAGPARPRLRAAGARERRRHGRGRAERRGHPHAGDQAPRCEGRGGLRAAAERLRASRARGVDRVAARQAAEERAGHGVGGDLTGAARVRARPRRDHERLLPADHDRVSGSAAGARAGDGRRRAGLHHRVQRRHARHRERARARPIDTVLSGPASRGCSRRRAWRRRWDATRSSPSTWAAPAATSRSTRAPIPNTRRRRASATTR